MNDICGIYLITNKINDKKYVGQSSRINFRWTHHIVDLRNNCHHNKHLQASWNKYGADNFEFSIIEKCTEDELNQREIYWINYYDSFNNGYNLDQGGSGARGYMHTQEEIEKMRRIKNPMIVLQFNSSFQLVQEWIGGASHVKKELKYTKECILMRCEHTCREMTMYKDSYWVYKDEYNHQDFSWDKYLNNECLIEKREKKIINARRIKQCDLSRNIIKIWDSYSELRQAGYNTSQISGICNQNRGKRTAYGCIWCFEDYDFSDGYFDIIDNYVNQGIEKRKCKVAKLDDDKNIIQIYPTMTDASTDVKVSPSNISVACKNGGKCKGYYWIKCV